MSYEFKKLEKSQAEFIITIKPEEYKKDLEKAAVRLSERAAIKGFRPGKAPYEMVKQQLGELKILEEALQSIVARTFFEAVTTEKLITIGQPDVKIEKLAPGNDLIFKATAALLPVVTLPNLNEIKIEKKAVAVGDKEVGETLDNLKKMQSKEVIKNGPATKEDKVIIAMEMFLDKVPVEGGQAPNHQVYLSEAHYIPGLAEQLVGLKKDELKEFNLKFPADHYQKHIAGRNVDFKIKVKDVFTLEYPEVDDVFAKALGQASVAKLKELLLGNLTREAENKEDHRQEEAILEQMIEKSKFEDLPEILVDSEKRKMFYELKNDLERRGLDMAKYLLDIKKTEAQIFADFKEGAEKRAKAALISRQVAKDNDIKVEKTELDQEIEEIKKAYPGDEKVAKNLKRPEVIDTIAATVQNRKVISYLKEKIIT
ncbi:MAG: trigger factor [Candidatus Magasanikbacteria bacterium]|nr:trigger factor [Candidatus Magasanikbacteria bacterium]